MIDAINTIDLFKRVFQLSSECILVFSEDKKIIMVNPTCATLFKYPSKTLLGKNIELLVPTIFDKPFKKNKADSSDKIAIEGIKKDGTKFNLNIRLNTTTLNENTTTIVFLEDTTKQQEHLKIINSTTTKLTESNRKFDTLINNLQGIVYCCKNDQNATMEYINQGCKKITGYSAEEFLNGSIHFPDLTLKEDKEKVRNCIKKSIHKKKAYNINFRIKDRKGTIKYLHELGRGIFNKNGELEALEGIITDITTQKENEIQLHSSETKIKAILEVIPDLMFVHNKNGTIEHIYSSQPTLLYKPINSFIEKNVSEVFPAQVSKSIKKALLKAHQSKKMVIEELTIPKKNNQLIYEFRFMPFNSNKIFTIARDFTKKRLSEQKITANEAKMKALLEVMPDIIFIQDVKGTYLNCFTSNTDKLFLPPEKFIGKKMKDVLPINIYKKIKAAFEKLIASKKMQIAEYSYQSKKGIEHFEARIVFINKQRVLTIIRDVTEEKNTNALLNIRNNALESANNSIIIVDAQQATNPIIYCNKAFTELTGYTEKEVLGKNCNFLQNDDRDQKEIDIMRNAILKGEICNVQLRNYKKDGTMFWNDVTITPVFNKKNKLTHFIGVQNDVTSKVLEQGLKDKIQKILELITKDKPIKTIGQKIIETVETHIKNCTASILVLDNTHKTLHKLVAPNLPEAYCNYIEGTKIGPKIGSCGTASYLKEEIIVSNIKTSSLWKDYKDIALKNGLQACWAFPILSSNNQVLGTFAIYSTYPRKPLPVEKEILLDMTYLASIAIEKHNNTIALQESKNELEKYTQKLEEKVQERTEEVMATVQKLVASNLDLEDQIIITKQAEKDAITSKSIASEIAKNFPNGFVAVADKNYKILFAEGDAIAQLKLKDFVGEGKSVDDITIFSAERIAHIKDNIKRTLNGEYLSYETNYKNRYFSVNTAPLTDENNEISNALHVYSDISEQKEIEFSMQNALKKERELNNLKSRFISMASHEFRTPLSAILTSAILIGKQNEEGKELKRKKYVAQIEKNVTNLNVILNDFLSLSKLEEGKVVATPKWFDLISFSNKLVKECKTGLKKGQKINIISSQKKLLVYLDIKLLSHIINNLLSNASKYSSDNAEIAFKIQKDLKTVQLEITDQGIGIPDEEQKHLFDRFFRAKNAANIEGTGLGLNIVKNYTELMGGSIKFKSELNKGSTFWVQFPLENKVSKP